LRRPYRPHASRPKEPSFRRTDWSRSNSVVDIAAAIGGHDPDDSYVVLGATILAAAAIVAGGVGVSLPEEPS